MSCLMRNLLFFLYLLLILCFQALWKCAPRSFLALLCSKRSPVYPQVLAQIIVLFYFVVQLLLCIFFFTFNPNHLPIKHLLTKRPFTFEHFLHCTRYNGCNAFTSVYTDVNPVKLKLRRGTLMCYRFIFLQIDVVFN